MQTTIQVSKKLIFFLLFLVSGIAFVICGFCSLQKERRAIDINLINKGNCVKGKYVVGNISSCVVRKIPNLGNGSYSGVSQVWLVGAKEYAFFTIPVGESNYICIMVSDKDKVAELENLYKDGATSIYFEGEIIESPVDINYKWYEGISDKEFSGVENILTDYVIKEANFEDYIKKIYIGIMLLVCAYLQYISMGKMSDIVVKEKLVEKRADYAYSNSYNKENELTIEKRILLSLHKELYELKLGCLWRIPFFLFGLIMIKNNYYWEMKFVGIIISGLAIKGMVRYILNLGWKSTEWFLKLIGKESITNKINKCKQNIILLEDKIRLEK